MSDRDFNPQRYAEWLDATGYEEKDAPYSWCLSALNDYPENVIARSIRRFMEAWRYGYAAGLKEHGEVSDVVPIPDRQGVCFGKAWLSYDKILGYSGQDGPQREEFYRNDGIAREFMAWAKGANDYLTKSRAEKPAPLSNPTPSP